MKRFYIKRIGDFVTIVHRPTHQTITMGSLDEEMGKQIKRFIKMTTEEFYKELYSFGLKFKTTKNIKEEQDKEKEDWYKSAWSFTTKQVLDHYKLKEDSIPEEEVPLEFHSRFDSKGKKYIYTILNREEPPTIERNYVYHFPKKLDVDLMRQGSKFFIGEHEFDSFYKKSGSTVKSTLRNIYYCDVIKRDNLIEFIVIGNGFLYNMVRIMAGTLIEVGIGRIQPKDIQDILLAKDREKAGRSLPPQGLCLYEVLYW